MADIREQLTALLAEHVAIVRPLMVECRGCAVSFSAEEGFTKHLAELVEQKFVVVQPEDTNCRFVNTLVDHAFRAAKTSVTDRNDYEVYSADNVKHAIGLLAAAVVVLEQPEDGTW